MLKVSMIVLTTALTVGCVSTKVINTRNDKGNVVTVAISAPAAHDLNALAERAEKVVEDFCKEDPNKSEKSAFAVLADIRAVAATSKAVLGLMPENAYTVSRQCK